MGALHEPPQLRNRSKTPLEQYGNDRNLPLDRECLEVGKRCEHAFGIAQCKRIECLVLGHGTVRDTVYSVD